MKQELTTFDGLSIEARTEVIKEMFDQSLKLIETTEVKTRRLGELLVQQKLALGHGKWLPWIQETFRGVVGIRQVQKYVRAVLPNTNFSAHLDDATTEPDAPESERKSGQVEVVTPENTPSPGKGHHSEASSAATGKAERASRKASAKGNPESPSPRKTVEAELINPQSRVESTEATCSRLSDVSSFVSLNDPDDVLQALVEQAADKAKFAKKLRKLADQIDPADEVPAGKAPSATQLVSAIPDTMSPVISEAAVSWARYKQSLKGESKIQSLETWSKTCKRMVKLASEKTDQRVAEMVDKAISNGWRGWEHEGNGEHHGTASNRSGPRGKQWTAAEVFG